MITKDKDGLLDTIYSENKHTPPSFEGRKPKVFDSSPGSREGIETQWPVQ